MSEAEKQEGQKTVVAFITGLLIGGLLVWVFSSTPENTTGETKDEGTTTEETTSDTTGTKETTIEAKKDAQVVTGNGSLTVLDQKAGSSVTLGEVKYPATAGWIVVREFRDGMPANILGAARYNTETGLLPTSVPLQRATVTGGAYQAVFFTENGDNNFEIGVDVVVTGGEATFKAN